MGPLKLIGSMPVGYGSFEGNSGKQPLLDRNTENSATGGHHWTQHVDNRNRNVESNARELVFDGDQGAGGPPSNEATFSTNRLPRSIERTDAEERGEGSYSLHAVIGQGSFGRIHLASWRGNGEAPLNVVRAAPSTPSHGSRSLVKNFRGGQSHHARHAVGWKSPFMLQRSLPGYFGTTAARTRDSRADAAAARRVKENDEDDVVQDRAWRRLRALKSVCKRKMTERSRVNLMETELAVLQRCSHPFIVSLVPGGHFQTSGHLHLVLDYCPGGDLFSLMEKGGGPSESQARTCVAQLGLALRHLHKRHIAYRDLKPENVCLDARGHVVLVDFSLARIGLDEAVGGKAYTFCGSEAYVAPEMLAKTGHDTRVDLWALGCVAYEMLVGSHPFRKSQGGKSDRQSLFQRIQQCEPDYPSMLPRVSESLIRGLLNVDPDKRLGFGPPSMGVDPASPQACPGYDLERRVADWGSSSKNVGNPDRAHRRRRVCDPTSRAISDEPDGRGDAARPPRSMNSRKERFSDDGDVVTRANVTERVPLLFEHPFFHALPGWDVPTAVSRPRMGDYTWAESLLRKCDVMVPELRDALDVQYFDPKFTSQPVELTLQGHPHKGGPTPGFSSFQWRQDDCIEYAQIREQRPSGFLSNVASALLC